jgi:hypothetical protein
VERTNSTVLDICRRGANIKPDRGRHIPGIDRRPMPT